MEQITFPTVAARNLQRKIQTFPEDFPGKYTIALLAFHRYQQAHIDTWLPLAKILEKLFPEVGYIELPIVYQKSMIGQVFLNEGMRAGIPDNKDRERTTTLYLDKAKFMRRLKITTQDQIQVLLLSDQGEVLWRESGLFSSDKAKALINELQNLTNPVTSAPIS